MARVQVLPTLLPLIRSPGQTTLSSMGPGAVSASLYMVLLFPTNPELFREASHIISQEPKGTLPS